MRDRPSIIASALTIAVIAMGLILTGVVLATGACGACEDLPAGTSSPATVLFGTTTSTTVTSLDAAEPSGTEEPSAPPAGDSPSEADTTSSTLFVAATGLAAPVAHWTRFEETDPRLHWIGPWIDYGPLAGLSGDWCRLGQAHATVSFRFEGTRVRLVAAANPGGVIARVTLDGDSFNIDLYGDPGTPQSVLWTSAVLSFGAHELEFAWTEDRNPAALASVINLDAVDVFEGTLLD